MKILVAKDYAQMSSFAADLVEKVCREKPDCRLGLATGSTPVGMYQELARRCAEEGLDFSKVSSVNLDEYVGLAGDHPQSYRRFMDENLFEKINIPRENTHVISGTGDVEENIRDYQKIVDEKPIDLQVLGIGVDGHIAFNEPGKTLVAGVHQETLDESTIRANARFFEDDSQVPRRALTMGIGDIMRARRLVVLVNGTAKAAVTKQLLMSDEITTENPVTMVKMHADATIILDRELADAIGYQE